MHRNHDKYPQSIAEGLQERYERTGSRWFLLQYCDALVFEWFGKFNEFGSFWIDGQRRHNKISSFVHNFANESGPLFAYGDHITGQRLIFQHIVTELAVGRQRQVIREIDAVG